jgi:hypothetical protein
MSVSNFERSRPQGLKQKRAIQRRIEVGPEARFWKIGMRCAFYMPDHNTAQLEAIRRLALAPFSRKELPLRKMRLSANLKHLTANQTNPLDGGFEVSKRISP